MLNCITMIMRLSTKSEMHYTPYEVGPKLALWLDANDTSTIINDDGNVSSGGIRAVIIYI